MLKIVIYNSTVLYPFSNNAFLESWKSALKQVEDNTEIAFIGEILQYIIGKKSSLNEG